MEQIVKNLSLVLAKIRENEIKFSRSQNSVVLVAVSKAQVIEKIKAAINAGQLHFGESYLQEALEKIKAINNENVIWHYIGHIQSKKAKALAQNFSWVQSVDSITIAEALNTHRPDNFPPLNVCIQVNISGETSKSGIAVSEILPLAQKILTLPKLKLRGLMAIPASSDDFATQLAHFQVLQKEFSKLKSAGFNLDTLSMGMSGDFAAAIAAGSTMVRIGTAIFGSR